MTPNLPTPEDFDAKLRALLSNAEVEPPADMWTRIEREMQTRKQRRGPVILFMRSQWVSAAAVVTLLTIGLGIWTSRHWRNTPDQDLMAVVRPDDPATGKPSPNAAQTNPKGTSADAQMAHNSQRPAQANGSQALPKGSNTGAGSNGSYGFAQPKGAYTAQTGGNSSFAAVKTPAKPGAQAKPNTQTANQPHQIAALRRLEGVSPGEWTPAPAEWLQQWMEQQPAPQSIMVQTVAKPQGPLPQVTWKVPVKQGPLSIAAHFRPEYAQQSFALSTDGPTVGASSFGEGFLNNPGLASTGLDPNNLREETSSLDQPLAPSFSFSTGIEVAYRVVGNLSLSAGVDYSQMQNSRTSTTYLLNPMTQERSTFLGFNLTDKNPDEFMLAANNQEPVTYAQNLQYVGLPLRTSYEIGQGSVRFFATAGVAPQILTGAAVTQDNLPVPTDKLPYNNLYLTAQFSAGLSVGLGQHYSLQLEPSYRLALTSVTNTDIASSYPYMVGIGLRLRAHL